MTLILITVGPLQIDPVLFQTDVLQFSIKTNINIPQKINTKKPHITCSIDLFLDNRLNLIA